MIDTKTKHDLCSGTFKYKTTRIFLCFVFCSALGLCFDYVLMVVLMSLYMSQTWLHSFFCLLFVPMFKPAAHERKQFANGLARQFAQLFPLVCGGVFVRISPCNTERKISVMFDIQNSPYHGCRTVLTIQSDMEFYSKHGLENRFE